MTKIDLGNNNITEIREIQHLRPLQKLIILDLSGNPVSKTPGYRSFLIYKMQKLRVRLRNSIQIS